MKRFLLTSSLLYIVSLAMAQNFGVQGTVRDKSNKKPLQGAVVTMVGSDGSVAAMKTDTGGHYAFMAKSATERYVKAKTSYILSADGRELKYLAGQEKAAISTTGLTESKIWIEDFVLEKTDRGCGFPRSVFGFGESVVTEATKDSLKYLVQLLNDNPAITIELDGHCSPDEGSAKITAALSFARANACRDYLILQGIDSARVKAKGWGTTMTLPGCSAADIAKMKTKEEKEEAYKEDRRVEFRVLSFNYVPKGGYSHEDSLQIKKLQNIGTGK